MHVMSNACVCAGIRKASRALTQFYDRQLRPSGLRATQFNILALIRAFGEANLAQLSEELLMDQTTLTRNVQLLQRKRLLRKVLKSDGRVKTLSLTAQGETAFRAAAAEWNKAQKATLKTLGAQQWTKLQSSLEVLAKLGA